MNIKRTTGEKVFSICNGIIMILMMVIMLYPFYYVIVCSLSNSSELIGQKGIMLWPKGFSLNAYKYVLRNPNVMTGYRTTLFLVTFGTALNVFITSLAAYILSRPKFAIKNLMLSMIIITMFFSGGMIPKFLLIYNTLGLKNNLLALILPGTIVTWNLMIMKTNFQAIPSSLIESAKIDGANDFTILFRIVMPLSLSVISVMILFYGVGHWNSWFDAMLYIRKREVFPLSLILREILVLSNMQDMTGGAGIDDRFAIGKSIQYATIIVATLPILLVYPFIQKYFVKGMMIGAIKG